MNKSVTMCTSKGTTSSKSHQFQLSPSSRLYSAVKRAVLEDDALTLFSFLLPLKTKQASSAHKTWLEDLLLWCPNTNITAQTMKYHDVSNRYSLFINAVYYGHRQVVETILHHFNVSGLLENRTVLMIGANSEGMARLITDVTPLWLAVYRGHYHVVRLLLEFGADVHARTSTGSTPLRAATYNCDYTMVDELLSHGAEPNASNIYGNTCLMLAANLNDPNIVNLMLSSSEKRPVSVDVNQKARCGSTALHFALDRIVRPGRTYDSYTIRQLLQKGATHSANHLEVKPVLCAGMSMAIFHSEENFNQCHFADVAHAWDLAACEVLNYRRGDSNWDSMSLEPPGIPEFYNVWELLEMAFKSRERWNGVRRVGGDLVNPCYGINSEDAFVEVTTFDQLEMLSGSLPLNQAQRLIQRLLTRERILGPNYPELTEDRAALLPFVTILPTAKKVRDFGLIIAFGQKDAGFLSIFQPAMQQLVTDVHRNQPIRDAPNTVKLFLDATCGLVEDRALMTFVARKWLDSLATILFGPVIELLTGSYSFSLSRDAAELKEVKETLEDCHKASRLPAIRASMRGSTPLHTAFHRRFDHPALLAAHEAVTNMVIDMEENLNSMQLDTGRTPLHNLMMNIHQRADSPRDRALLMLFLCRMLERGAHPDIMDCRGKSPALMYWKADCLSCPPAERMLNSYVTLQCLSARVVHAHRARFEIPTHLVAFVRWHGPYVAPSPGPCEKLLGKLRLS